MTLAVMALFADGTTRLDNIASWRVKETDRHRGHVRASCASSAHRSTEGADFLEIAPPAQWRAAAFATYDDHRMAMCLALAAFNPLRGARQRASPGAGCRCASSIRAASARPFPTTSKPCSASCTRRSIGSRC